MTNSAGSNFAMILAKAFFFGISLVMAAPPYLPPSDDRTPLQGSHRSLPIAPQTEARLENTAPGVPGTQATNSNVTLAPQCEATNNTGNGTTFKEFCTEYLEQECTVVLDEKCKCEIEEDYDCDQKVEVCSTSMEKVCKTGKTITKLPITRCEDVQGIKCEIKYVDKCSTLSRLVCSDRHRTKRSPFFFDLFMPKLTPAPTSTCKSEPYTSCRREQVEECRPGRVSTCTEAAQVEEQVEIDYLAVIIDAKTVGMTCEMVPTTTCGVGTMEECLARRANCTRVCAEVEREECGMVARHTCTSVPVPGCPEIPEPAPTTPHSPVLNTLLILDHEGTGAYMPIEEEVDTNTADQSPEEGRSL